MYKDSFVRAWSRSAYKRVYLIDFIDSAVFKSSLDLGTFNRMTFILSSGYAYKRKINIDKLPTDLNTTWYWRKENRHRSNVVT